MSSRTLADLDISVTRSPAGYVATMRTPDGRRAQTTFETPFEEFQLKYYIAAVTRGPQPARRSSQTSADTVARELGSVLFGAMFSGAALQRLDATLDTLALSRQQGVRLRIDLSGAPELAGLPWEFLYHPERNFFLALSPDLTIVRYVQTPEPVRTLRVDPPLRILAMACSPRDLDPLDIARERENLQASLERLTTARMVEIDWAPANTLHSVTAMLDQRDYHIFHFMGHGVSMQEEGRTAGYLLFEDASGAAAPVSAERLGQAFRRSVRLALINACEGAVGDLHNPSAGVATSLLTQGVPAVVAMQFSISDAIAIPFAGEFYSAIAIGLPVDAAMTSARRNVWARFDDSGEWATPVLFLRSPDGHIFDVGAFAGGDVQTSALQQEVIAATMDNLDVDLTQLRTILSTGSREVLKRLPGWLTDRWSSVDRSAEELYQQAVEHMHTERWADANRFFKLCNDRSPGYRDIVALWQQSKLQERLAEHYRRLVSAYAEQKWQRVMELAAAILAEAPSYKDTLALYNRSVQMRGMMPRPSGLPSSSPDRPTPSQTRPSSTPQSTTPPVGPPTSPPPTSPPAERPPTLPQSRQQANGDAQKPDDRPSSLPGRLSC